MPKYRAECNQLYGNRAVKGGVWIIASTAISKVASLGSQFVLGWLLSHNDFGVYALAIAISSLALTMRNGGTEQVLIQRGAQFEKIALAVKRLAMGFNFFLAVALALLAPLFASLYQVPEITYLCWIVAASLPFATPIVIYKARLSIDLKFSVLAKVALASALVRQGATIVLALLGFGVYSFVIPLLLVGVFEWMAYRRAAKVTFPIHRKEQVKCIEIFRDSKWVLLGAGATWLSMQGDYLVLGLIVATEIVGSYFFGYQLLASVVLLFAAAVQMVMMPSFMRFSHDEERLRAAYEKALRVAAFILMPLGVIVSMLSEPLLVFLWGEKWMTAVVVIQFLAFAMPFWIFTSLSLSIFETKARWRLRTGLMYVDALGVTLSAYLGAVLGSLEMIALCMAVYRCVFGLIASSVAAKLIGLNVVSTVIAVMPPITIALICGGVAYGFVKIAAGLTALQYAPLYLVLGFFTGYMLFSFILINDRMREVVGVIRSLQD